MYENKYILSIIFFLSILVKSFIFCKLKIFHIPFTTIIIKTIYYE